MANQNDGHIPVMLVCYIKFPITFIDQKGLPLKPHFHLRVIRHVVYGMRYAAILTLQ